MATRVRFFFVFALMMFAWVKMNASEEGSKDYLKYVDEITRRFSKEIKKEFGIECTGSGGSMPHDVQEISMEFVAYQRATVEQARELEVKITEKFVQAINAHEKIRPFLREFPFPSGRTEVGISFFKRNNIPYIDGSVAYVSHIRSKIHYRAEDPDNPHLFKPITSEPYEEALKIVQENAATKTARNPEKL